MITFLIWHFRDGNWVCIYHMISYICSCRKHLGEPILHYILQFFFFKIISGIYSFVMIIIWYSKRKAYTLCIHYCKHWYCCQNRILIAFWIKWIINIHTFYLWYICTLHKWCMNGKWYHYHWLYSEPLVRLICPYIYGYHFVHTFQILNIWSSF